MCSSSPPRVSRAAGYFQRIAEAQRHQFVTSRIGDEEIIIEVEVAAASGLRQVRNIGAYYLLPTLINLHQRLCRRVIEP